RPGDRQRERHRLRGKGIEHGGNPLLVEQREARHQHRAGQQVGDVVAVHASTPRLRNASRMAMKPNTKATPTKSGRRKTRILAMLPSHRPSRAAHSTILAVQAASPISQPAGPAAAGAMPNGANRQTSSEKYSTSFRWLAASISARCRPEY